MWGVVVMEGGGCGGDGGYGCGGGSHSFSRSGERLTRFAVTEIDTRKADFVC